MARNSDLFDLIKSLSKTEKRYFRRVASFHSGGEPTKYERLFDLIDRQQEYDEEAIRRALADDPLARNLSEAKYYLYNTIFKALHLYHLEHSKFAQISLLIHQAELLLERKLYGQFARTIARAKELSVRYEQWHLTIAILRLEYRMLLLEPDDKKMEEQRAHLFGEIHRYFDIFRDLVCFWEVNSRLDMLDKVIGTPRSHAQLEAYRDALGAASGHNKSPLSTGAKIYYYMNRAIVLEASCDHTGALDAYLSVLPIIESSEHWSRPVSLAVIPVLGNICLMSLALSEEKIFFEHHARLIAMIDKSTGAQEYAMYISALRLLIDWHSRAGEFGKARAVQAEAELEMKLFSGKLPIGLTVAYRMSAFNACFGAGEYAMALDHINAIINRATPDVSDSAFPLAKILALVVHYELGNRDLLEYLVHSTQRLLKSHDRLYAVEETLLRFFRKICKLETVEERMILFRELHDELTAMMNDPFESPIIGTFDLVSWAESGTTGRSYAEIIHEAHHRRAITIRE